MYVEYLLIGKAKTSFLPQASLMQVVTRKASLENALEIGDWLIEKSHEDPVVVFEVRTRLNEAGEAVEDISLKLSSHKSEAQKMLLSEQEYTDMADDLEERLDHVEAQFSLLDAISARYLVARQQHEYFKPLFHQVQQLRDCQEALASFHESETGAEGEAQEHRFHDLTKRWHSVWHTVANYHLHITAVLPFEERHHYAMKKLLSVLSDNEKQLEKLQVAFSAGENEHAEADVKVVISKCLPHWVLSIQPSTYFTHL